MSSSIAPTMVVNCSRLVVSTRCLMNLSGQSGTTPPRLDRVSMEPAIDRRADYLPSNETIANCEHPHKWPFGWHLLKSRLVGPH